MVVDGWVVLVLTLMLDHLLLPQQEAMVVLVAMAMVMVVVLKVVMLDMELKLPHMDLDLVEEILILEVIKDLEDPILVLILLLAMVV